MTAALALLPIGVGAVVTTVDAGMAFADWPTSNGQGMLAYPWLKSTGDQFLEHGHRLAGMLIGVMSLVLAAVAFSTDTRGEVRTVVVAIVCGVIAQGLLGGWRVVADERVIALLHGNFAAWVFSLMGLLVAMTGPNWLQPLAAVDPSRARAALVSAVVTLVLLTAQYVMGGLLRHLGSAHAWLIHPWFAIAVLLAAVAFFVAALRTGSPELRRAGTWVLGLIVAQAALGVATWAVKYGYPQFDIMAVQQSSLQIAVRSLHKVVGLVTFMTVVVSVVRAARAVPAFGRLVPATVVATGGRA
jgi:cytochrome c oxidase assembly protein subunit 15